LTLAILKPSFVTLSLEVRPRRHAFVKDSRIVVFDASIKRAFRLSEADRRLEEGWKRFQYLRFNVI
jgi:hypothetical protein